MKSLIILARLMLKPCFSKGFLQKDTYVDSENIRINELSNSSKKGRKGGHAQCSRLLKMANHESR